MKENSIKNERSSIEEDIKIAVDKFSDNKDIDSAMLIVEKFILGNYILLGGNRGNIVKDSLRYILSDYKRILKENEELLEVKVSASAHNRILELEKENEELKEEIGVDYTTVYLKGVYDEREKQQKEIKEKNKIINLMAEHIFYNQDDTFPLAYSIKDTKDYFENKAKKR